MARPKTGNVRTSVRTDGTSYYSARITVDGDRVPLELGDERDGVTKLMAEGKLDRILEQVRLGTWDGEGRKGGPPGREPEPLMVGAAARFLDHKRGCQLRDSTIERITWALDGHLVPFFGKKRPSQITPELVERYAAHEVAQRTRIAELREDGKYLTGPRGGAMREMSNVSINRALTLLAELLTWTEGKGWTHGPNAAVGYRLKEAQRITFALEPDELADLLAAVATPRPPRRPSARTAALMETSVRLRDEDGLEWQVIGRRLGIVASTAYYHYTRAKSAAARVDARRAEVDHVFVSVLAGSGARVTELCKLDVEDVDLPHSKFLIADSKTPTGIREVKMTPALVKLVRGYFASRPDLAPNQAAFPNSRGTRRTKDSVNKQVLVPAIALANELRAERSERKLPRVTPHVMRHTYITLAFEAGYSVPYVMQQVGHREPGTTMKIYAKVCARRDREVHDAAFDGLLADAAAARAIEPEIAPITSAGRELVAA